MGRRSKRIARSIVRALTEEERGSSKKRRGAGTVAAFFRTLAALYELPLEKVRADLFERLRHDSWQIDEGTYVGSFRAGTDEEAPETALEAMGDMGYSGSTFFDTKDKRFLVKSIPRPFEHTFFRDDLLEPYGQYMDGEPHALLVRICDFLASPTYPLGSVLRLAPTHHIIMENILYGQPTAATEDAGPRWTHWDLKPQAYFVPERDIADGRLTSAATKRKLADRFDDTLKLSAAQADAFLAQIARDTQLLADCNAVDYSLFLVRIESAQSAAAGAGAGTAEEGHQDPFVDPTAAEEAVMPRHAPFAPPAPPSWRTGVPSPEGRYVYRAVILDFFWAKHKTQPKLMTLLISAWNTCISRQGHMTITTDPRDYREQFVKMCREMVEVRAEEPQVQVQAQPQESQNRT